MKTKRIAQAIFWITVYLILTLAPSFLLLVGGTALTGRGFWREFSVALGFAGLATLALQFALTARIATVKAPYGSDVVYYFHRQISLVAFALVLAHPLILFIYSPGLLRLLNLFQTSWQARAGILSVLCLIALVITSIWRNPLKIDYTAWRITHDLLAIAAVALALMHVVIVGHYINTPGKQIVWIGYIVFWLLLLVYVRLIKPIVLLHHPYEVEQVSEERGNSWTLVIKPVGHDGITFQPGQFAWITAWTSPFSDTEHPFSFSSSACSKGNLAFTIKELGDFTRTIKQMKYGQRVYLDGPFGAFSIDRNTYAHQYAFIAGGIGITPIMSMLRTLADRRDQRPLLLIYTNDNWEGVTFREEIEQLTSRLNLQVVYVLSKTPENWEGEQGYVTKEILARYLPQGKELNEVEIFICGPEPMMKAVEKALGDVGVPITNIHAERFNLV